MNVYKEFYGYVKGESPKVGLFLQDKNQGQFAEEVLNSLPAHFQRSDAGEFFEKVSSVKTSSELEALSKAGKTSEFIVQKVILRIEDIINDEEKISHATVSDKIKKTLEDIDSRDYLKFKKSNPDILLDQIDTSIPIKIQSGGKYTFEVTDESNNELIKADTITISGGCDYGILTAATA